MAEGSNGNWRVVGASVQGVSHIRAGQPCQDAHAVRYTESGVLIAAVADGAGTAQLADVGSAVATGAAVDAAGEQIRDIIPWEEEDWRHLLKKVFEAAWHAVAAEAAKRERPPNDLATTLIVALAMPDQLAVGQVGDGAVVARVGSDCFIPITRPQAEEYINETTFLTSAESLSKMQFSVHKGEMTGLVMFSDGLQMLALKMPEAVPHVRFFLPLLQFVDGTPDRDKAEQQLRSFLQSPKITSRADDDLTLVLAVRDGIRESTGETQSTQKKTQVSC